MSHANMKEDSENKIKAHGEHEKYIPREECVLRPQKNTIATIKHHNNKEMKLKNIKKM